jgi:hypothetical protein
MEDFAKWNRRGAIVGIGWHQITHVVPPTLADIGSCNRLPAFLAFDFSAGEQFAGFRVEENGVTLYAVSDECFLQIFPDRVVATLVLGVGTGMDRHLEGFADHEAEQRERLGVSKLAYSRRSATLTITMIASLLAELKRRTLTLSGQSGSFVTSGSGMAPSEEGLIAVVISAVLGAFCGLLGGFIISHLFRYLTFLTGRNFGGFSWVIYGTIAGAIIFGCIAANSDEG